MPQFIGIQLPEELRGKIESFRRKYHAIGTEPHICLISSGLLSEVPVAQQKLESFCLSQADFQVTVSGQPIRRGDRIIFLPVVPGLITIMRDRLAKQLGCALPNTLFRPHVNLIRRSADVPLDFDAVFEDARRVFSSPYLLTVSQVALFTREEGQRVFTPTLITPFTGR